MSLFHEHLVYIIQNDEKICVARTDALSTSFRSPGINGLVQLAGPKRNPIVTSHIEYGVKCYVVSSPLLVLDIGG
jgi:hypothetical protein